MKITGLYPMAVSLKDISEHLDVSICIVSQVLNDHPRARSLRPETRQKILDAARELGYSRNEMAAAMAKKHSNVLAFVTGDMGSVEYTGRIQNGVLDAAAAHNYLVMLHRLNGFSPAETIQKILGWRAAGVVFHVARLDDICKITEVLDKNKIPWGTVNLSNPGGIGVTSDDFSGIEDVVRIFSRSGHAKVAYVTVGEGGGEFRQKREGGYLSGMRTYYPAAETAFIRLPEPEENRLNDMQETIRLIREQKIDAVICESDHIAAGLLRCTAQTGLRVPGDLSIAGFGDSVIAEYTNPPLTTVAQDFENMGRQTVRQIIHAVEKGRKEKTACQLLPTKIVFRQSVNEEESA